jgi:hypothetical protein
MKLVRDSSGTIKLYGDDSSSWPSGFRVSSDAIKQRWHQFSPVEQLQFAQAFSLDEYPLKPDDQLILAFLMEAGSSYVWWTIAPRLPEYRDRERALSFLLERISSTEGNLSNYYLALWQIGDLRAVPILSQRYNEYRNTLSPLTAHSLFTGIADYQECCRALWRLTNEGKFKESLEELLTHPDERVRKRTRFFLSNSERDRGG